jgi:chromosome segregation ATPase
MSHPTWEDFHRLETKYNQLEKEVEKLKEQRTDEMKAINVNVASADVLTRLDKIDGTLESHSERFDQIDQKLDEQSKLFDRIDKKQDEHAKALVSHSRSISTLQTDITEVKTRLARIETTMATKEDLKTMQESILDAIRKISHPGGNGHEE